MTLFRVIWPITDTNIPPADLLEQARADLQAVANRHGVSLTGNPRWTIRPGSQVPGSGGAALVVVADTTAHKGGDA